MTGKKTARLNLHITGLFSLYCYAHRTSLLLREKLRPRTGRACPPTGQGLNSDFLLRLLFRKLRLSLSTFHLYTRRVLNTQCLPTQGKQHFSHVSQSSGRAANCCLIPVQVPALCKMFMRQLLRLGRAVRLRGFKNGWRAWWREEGNID